MSEHDPNEHTSFIKTPKQLLVVVALAFIVPILLIAMVASLAMRSVEPSVDVKSDEAVAKRLKPVGQVVVAEGSDVPGQRTGKQVVEAVCSACHATGALNAPKLADTGAWHELIKDGHAHLTEMAIKGIRQMPPRRRSPVDRRRNGARGRLHGEPGRRELQRAADAGCGAWRKSRLHRHRDGGSNARLAGATSGASAAGAASGKAIFEANCAVCHGTGVAGAPKIGDKAAWAPRLTQGDRRASPITRSTAKARCRRKAETCRCRMPT